MRTLVIPDIHQRHVRAQQIIDKVPADKIVLLGDYFDAFGDSYREANNTAVWLRDFVLPNPKIIPLLGNHDTHYFWSWHHYFRCSGFTDSKAAAIAKELNYDNTNNFERFKFYHIDQGFLLSHAGLDNQLWKDLKRPFVDDGGKSKLEFVDEVLTYWVEKTKKQIANNHPAELIGAGWDRGGSQRIGGINWADFSHLSPIKGINQIVGHTPHKVPDVKIQKQHGSITVKTIFEYYDHSKFMPSKHQTSVNYAIDTHSNHYIIIEDGEVQVWDYIHDMKIQDLQQFAIPESPLHGLNLPRPDGAPDSNPPIL